MSADATYYGVLFFVLHVFTASTATLHALLFKADSRAAFGWIGVVIVFPYAGAFLYLIFGINRVRRKAQRRGILGLPWSETGLLPIAQVADKPVAPMQQVGRTVTGRTLVDSNRLSMLINGEAAFARMLESIEHARHQVLLMTYIFDDDATGQRFVAALGAAVARGVEVRVLIDDIGRRYRWPTILPALRQAGVDARCFMPIRLLPPSLSLNLRNHRKLLVVDGATGFAGGMNIGDRQLAESSTGHGSTDLHFEFNGPVVRDFATLFDEDWQRADGAPLAVMDAGVTDDAHCRCRVIPDGPDNHLDHLSMVIEGVISSASTRIRIVTPYFLPSRKLIGALQGAALRGVDVCVVLPSKNNWPIVQWALGHTMWELLNVGVRIVMQPPPFAHTKCIVIDDNYSLVGSTNLDPRSLRLNFELGIEVFSTDFNRTLSEHVEALCAVSTPVTREQARARGGVVRVRDALAALFSPYL
ncbi:MAG: phospholipase D-like domain-containing protein [Gammaproteobacteria bacterium]